MEQFTGEMFGLAAASMWAIGSIFFSRIRVSAAAMNLFKNSLGAALLLGTLLVTAVATGAGTFHLSQAACLYLGASAVVGLVIGDTFYFRSLQILGPRRALVLTTVAPPGAVSLGWLVRSSSRINARK